MFYNSIINCEFTYKCPTDWDKLTETEFGNIRHCDECDKTVKLCRDQKEVNQASEKGICIAHPIFPKNFEKKVRDYEAGIGENPFSDIPLTIGLPRFRDPSDIPEGEFDHFMSAQFDAYATILKELKSGEKKTHWIWFIFPQIAGLGQSSNSKKYALTSKEQAQSYWKHYILGRRLKECIGILIESKLPVNQILGELDAMKLKSCLTLFHQALPEESLFKDALKKLFKGDLDQNTLQIIKK
jgi:uncharacterized protein (DUF1810 family)